MSRGSSNGAKHAHATSGSSAFITSTVNTYIAGIGATIPTPSPPTSTTNHHSSVLANSASPRLSSKSPLGATSAHKSDTQSPSDRRKCANPFCGAPLESAFATYCEQKAHCQLYRGLLLHCGSFASEREREIDDAIEKSRYTKRRRLRRVADDENDDDSDDADVEDADDAMSAAFSIPKRKVPVASPTSSISSSNGNSNSKETHSESATQRKLRLRLERQQSASGSASSSVKPSTGSGTTTAPATPTGKKRRLVPEPAQSSERNSSQSTAAPPLPRTNHTARTPAVPAAPVPAPPVPAPPAPVAKVGGIEVIPLGAGRHPSSFGGGSRYVQSGNRAMSPGNSSLRGLHPLARPPLVSKPVVLPPEPPAVAPLPPAPTTVSPARDPRRIDTTSSTSTSSDALPVASVSHQDAGPAPKRTISASEYLSSRKPQDPRVRSSASTGFSTDAPSASVGLQRSASDLSSTSASTAFHGAAPREHTLHRGLSDPPVAAAAAVPVRSRSRSRSRDRTDHHQQHQQRSYASYDSAGAYSRREYESPRPRAYSPERYSHSHQHQQQHQHNDHHHHYAYEPDYRYPAAAAPSSSSSAYPQQAPPPSLASEPPKWSRPGDDSVRPHSRSPSRDHHHHIAPVSAPASSSSRSKLIDLTKPSTPTTPTSTRRDASGHPEIAPVAFSNHDWFVVDLLSRFASFFPQALSPVLNKTKKPRKMRFYLDYVQRVKDLSGARLDIQVTSGKATVMADSRVWIALTGSSTVELYTQVLETLLEQSVAWRKLLEDANRVYGNGVQTLGSRANHSDAFVRMWQGMKYNTWERFPLERQVRYFRGDKRHHWSFCVGNVELGSGSHEEKREAYRLGAENAMKFLLSLEILSDSRKYARVTRPERSTPQAPERETASSTRPLSRQNDAAARSTSSSTSEQQQAASVRPAAAPASANTVSTRSGVSDPRIRSTPSTTVATKTPAAPTPAAPAPSSAVEIMIDTPDVTVSRPRDDSFGSPADAAFSPPAASDQSPNGDGNNDGGDDMEISDGDSSATSSAPVTTTTAATTAAAPAPVASKPVANCSFCETVRARDPESKFCMRCKPKEPTRTSAVRRFGLDTALTQQQQSQRPASASFEALDVLQRGLLTRR